MAANEVFLLPGQIHFGGHSTRITTILGSCVALVCWHPALRIGGMCHYMLPHRPRLDSTDARYGDVAIARMLAAMRQFDATPVDFQIRLYGGGSMFPEVQRSRGRHIGLQNVDLARSLLQAHRLAAIAEDVAGSGHRRLMFDVASGSVELQRGLPGMCGFALT